MFNPDVNLKKNLRYVFKKFFEEVHFIGISTKFFLLIAFDKTVKCNPNFNNAPLFSDLL